VLRIREIRLSRGLTQRALADRAGVSRSQLCEIETGNKAANSRRLADIARALDVGVEALFSQSDHDLQITEIMRLSAELLPQDRRLILDLARRLADGQPLQDGAQARVIAPDQPR
jgi:transcriptional regulator with XRE-family HTH domain